MSKSADEVAETLANVRIDDYEYPGYHLSRMSEPLPAAIRYRLRHRSGQSATRDDFRVMVNVSQFRPEDLSVTVVDKCVLIHARHEEKFDDHGFIEREFTRRYVIPEGFDANGLTSGVSEAGVLVVQAPKTAEQQQSNERSVDIIHLSTGAVVEKP